MAVSNSDGSIILSTKVDTKGIDKFIKKYGSGLSGVTVRVKKHTEETKKQATAYEQLKNKIKEQTAELQRLKQEYSNVILTEGKTSDAAQNLATKMNTLSAQLDENKVKLAGVEQEANDLVASFSKVGDEAQESAQKPINAYQQLEITIAEQKAKLEELRQEYASLKLTNQANTAQAKKLRAEINNLSAEVAENEKRIKSLGISAKSAFSTMQKSLMTLASYFVGIQTIFAAFRFSGEAAEATTQTEASVQRLVDIYGEASQVVGDFIDANSRALGVSKASAASFASTYGNLLSVWADQATNAELTNALLNQTAVVATKTGRTMADVMERVRSGMLGNNEAIEDLGINVNIKTIEITDAFKRIANGRSWEQLTAYEQAQVRTLAILEQSVNKYGTEVANTTALTRARYQAAYEDFKATWGRFVNQVLMPILEVLTEIMTYLTIAMQIFGGFSSKTVEITTEVNDGMSKAVDNQNALTEATEETAEAQEKYLAGFDKVQKISDSSSGGGGGSNIASTLSVGDLSAGGNGEDLNTQKIASTLASLMAVAGSMLAAIGLILLFTGHPLAGISFIITGAAMLGVGLAQLNNEDVAATTSQKLLAVMGVIGGALVAIGALMLISGAAAAWGIGFIIAGAGLFGVSMAAITAGALDEDVASTIYAIMGVVGGALIAIGVILLVLGNIPFGLAFLLAGAGSLVTAIAPNWNIILDKIKDMWKKIKEWWNANVAPIFTVDFWASLAKNIGNGLISGVEAAVNGIIWLFEKMINFIVDGLNLISIDVPDWVPAIGGKKFGFNLNQVDFGEVSIPRLAQGAVIPPNKEFLAVLGDQKNGTNIEAPLATIKQAVSEALNGSDGGNIELTVLLDSDIIYKKVVQRNRQNTIRTGKNALAY